MARIPLGLAAALGLAALAVGARLALYLARGRGVYREPPALVRWWREWWSPPLYPELEDRKPSGIVHLAPGSRRGRKSA